MLKDKIKEALNQAMLAQDKERVKALRLIVSDIKKFEIDHKNSSKGPFEMDDTGVENLLFKMIKQRRDSIKAYQEGNRQDLVIQEQAEIDVISQFLPKVIEGDELTGVIKQAIATVVAQSPRDMGKVMAYLKQQYGSKIDMSQASAMIKQLLI
ncbi:MAG: GatB/YqeY domain-containing protein [Pseudomonadota bacterium]